jgi:SAM-dependent methyltransferase
MRHLTPPPAAEDFTYWMDRWSFMQGTLQISGYGFSRTRETTGVRLLLADGRHVPIPAFGLPSADLTRRWGPAAAACRLSALVPIPEGTQAVVSAQLEFTFADGSREIVRDRSAEELADPVSRLLQKFTALLHELPPGHILEVGSRNRTGDSRRGYVPATWRYTGTDIVDGENVDVIGDVHEASTFLPHETFDAMMSFAVFEHLLMPWKAAVELNRLLKPGAIGLIVAPQSWPLHEEPWDYFRFSRHAWKAIFNPSTGYEIIEAVDGHRAFIIAERTTPSTAWGELFTGALMSAALVRKTGTSTVDWPVRLRDVTQDHYPL